MVKNKISNDSIIFMQDSYTTLYACLAKSLLQEYGLLGEAILRRGTRNYGTDRGIVKREQHIAAGYKVNMQNLFSVGFDLPSDPRFRRELQTLNPEERISHTLVCPMADLWKDMGCQEIGRIYCEEFHFACYNSYAYGYTKVNLARTLTQDNDSYCSFSIILRPDNLPDELKPKCFQEYDVNYSGPKEAVNGPVPKEGFAILCIKLLSHLLDAAINALGEDGRKVIADGLDKYKIYDIERLKHYCNENSRHITKELLEELLPYELDLSETIWSNYNHNNAKYLLEKEYLYGLIELVDEG